MTLAETSVLAPAAPLRIARWVTVSVNGPLGSTSGGGGRGVAGSIVSRGPGSAEACAGVGSAKARGGADAPSGDSDPSGARGLAPSGAEGLAPSGATATSAGEAGSEAAPSGPLGRGEATATGVWAGVGSPPETTSLEAISVGARLSATHVIAPTITKPARARTMNTPAETSSDAGLGVGLARSCDSAGWPGGPGGRAAGRTAGEDGGPATADGGGARALIDADDPGRIGGIDVEETLGICGMFDDEPGLWGIGGMFDDEPGPWGIGGIFDDEPGPWGIGGIFDDEPGPWGIGGMFDDEPGP